MTTNVWNFLNLKDKPAPTAQQSDDIGDHADNDIQRHSKKWHKPIDIEDVFDDCGDNLTAVELPEEENQYSIFSEGSSQFSDSAESINNTKNLYDSELSVSYTHLTLPTILRV